MYKPLSHIHIPDFLHIRVRSRFLNFLHYKMSFFKPIERIFRYLRMSSLYIITSPLHEKAGQYKVGIHTGDSKKLISRYRTAIPGIEIKMFILLATGKAKEVEDKIKIKFATGRIINSGGNDSEFYQVPLKALYGFISSLLEDAAPLPPEEDEKKIQEQLKEFKNAMTPIEICLQNMERSIPPQYTHVGSIADLSREIQLEKTAFSAGNFKGEYLLSIRKLVMENYSKCMYISQPYYGKEIVDNLRGIVKAMDEVNKKFPETFKKVPRIVELNHMGTEKDDMIYRKAVWFGPYAMNGTYVQKNWDLLDTITPEDWYHITHNFRPELSDLTPKMYIKKFKNMIKKSGSKK